MAKICFYVRLYGGRCGVGFGTGSKLRQGKHTGVCGFSLP